MRLARAHVFYLVMVRNRIVSLAKEDSAQSKLEAQLKNYVASSFP